jgi:predicted AAA+ superfamily ATPase
MVSSLRQQLPRLLQPPRQSFFLFGPRGSGKSTWVKQRFPRATRIDLLDEALFQELLAAPGRFADLLRGLPARAWVCVDEIQRLPPLLNEVHRAIEDRGLRFALTGSSARRLRRAGVNLLAGRALRLTMHPFLPAEMEGRFRLEEALQFGTLPVVLASGDAAATLEAYVLSYLREEIQAEALVRNLGGFSRFLPIAALLHGQVVNVSAVARDAGVARTTVLDYFEILVDTLLGFQLPAYEARLRVRERRHPKWYWVDPGLVRAAKRQLGPVAVEERGTLFEGLVATQLRAWNDYRGRYDELAYWAPTEGRGLEVDFLLRRGRRFVAIEVKSSERLRNEDRAGLDAVAALPGLERRLLVYPRTRRLTLEGGIEVMGFDDFSELLSSGRL